MADAQPQTKDLFDNPAAFGLTPARPDAAKPAADQPSPDFDPARFQLTPTPVPQGIDPLTRLPYQSVGNIPSNDPVGQSTGRPIQEDRAPGISVQAAGSMATDPEQKRRIVAAQLFPDLGPQAAQSRVFYGPNGRMAAVGMDGQPYYVDPDRPDFSALRTFSPANLVSNVGALAGPALPAAGGIIAGSASPTTLVGGPLLAAGGAMVGDLIRQTIAGRYDPGVQPVPGAPPQPVPYNLRQTGGEALGAGTGQLAGAGFVRMIAPNKLALSATDIRNIRANPDILTEANRLFDQAASQGVDLTPGQATGLPSLLSHEDVLASGSVGAGPSDIAAARYATQRQQLNDLYQHYLDTVSSASDKTDAAMQFQQGVEDAQRIVRQQANAAARPSYQAAQGGGQVMSPDLAQLSELPAMQDALKAAAVDYQNRTGKVANIDAPDFDLWNIAKRKLDEAVNKAKVGGDYSNADVLDSVRSRLLTNLDAAYPTYQAARDIAAPGQRQAARMESSLGRGGAGDETAKQVTAPIFNSNNPRSIAENRDAFLAAGRQDEWNAGIRAYLQDTFDNVIKSQEGLNPSMLRKQLWSDPNRAAAMQAAMTPEQFQGLNNVMETIEAVARSKGINSLTAPRLTGAAEIRGAAGDTTGVQFVRGVSHLLSPDVLNVVKHGGDTLAEWMTQRNIGKLGDQFFGNPARGAAPESGMSFLNQAARMAPGDRRLVVALANFLGQQGGSSDVVTGRATTPGIALLGPRNQLAPAYGP